MGSIAPQGSGQAYPLVRDAEVPGFVYSTSRSAWGRSRHVVARHPCPAEFASRPCFAWVAVPRLGRSGGCVPILAERRRHPGVRPEAQARRRFLSTDLTEFQRSLSDRYEVGEEIARGGSGVVFRARDLKHDRVVAIKVLLPELSATLARPRFLKEIRLSASLIHPHILPVYDSGEADGHLYLIMPFVEGESLGDRIRRQGKVEPSEAVSIALEVADALAYAHGRGIVHRDIKPSNLLLSHEHVVVADFGVARAIDEASEGSGSLTRTGLIVGTPMYMSPEQVDGHRADARSDVYALGCVLFEMSTGRAPFQGETAMALMAAHYSQAPPRVEELDPSVPREIARAVDGALVKDPDQRLQTAADFAAVLTGREPATQAPGRRRKRLPSPGLATASDLFRTYAAAGGLSLVLLALITAIGGWPTWPLFGLAAALVAGLPVVALVARRAARSLDPAKVGHLPLTATWTARPRSLSGPRQVLPVVVAVLLLWVAASAVLRQGSTGTLGTPSIAVVPFRTPTGGPSELQFASALHGEVLSQLYRIAALRVIARGSVTDYDPTTALNPRQVAEELGVGYVLGASLRRTAGRVSLNLELFGRDGRSAWSGSYERAPAELVSLPAEIARQVSTAMSARLTDEEREYLARSITLDPQAYEDYLLAQDFLRSGFDEAGPAREARFRNALERADRVVAAEPTFANAYALAGQAHLYMYWFGFDQDPSRLERAREALDRSLELSPDLPDAQFGLGYFHYWANRDYEVAERYFENALEGRPGDAGMITAVGLLYRRQGRVTEAAAEQVRGFERDPRNPAYGMNLAFTYRGLRQFDQTVRYLDRAIALSPGVGGYQYKAEALVAGAGDLAGAQAVLDEARPIVPEPRLVTAQFWVHLYAGDFPAALADLERFDGPVLGQPFVVGAQGATLPMDLLRGYVYAAAGDRATAREHFSAAVPPLEVRLAANPSDPRVLSALAEAYAGFGRANDAMAASARAEALLPVDMDAWSGGLYMESAARVLAAVGQPESALERLRTLLEMPYNTGVTVELLKIDPRWDPLRGDPAFERLLAGR